MEPLSTILVCFAVEAEARVFRGHATSRSNIQILLTGMGTKNAEKSIRAAFAETKPTAVISSGFAGALNPGLSVGTVLFDCEPETGILDAISLSDAQPATFYNVNKVLVSETEKMQLRKERNVDAVDMESKVIREICREFHIPSGTIRVISDAANEELPLNFNNFMTPDLRMDYLKLVLEILKSPRTLIRLLRFNRSLQLASRNLATVLNGVIKHT